MTEDEKKAIRASFAGKRVSQMTELERKVLDEDFQYGVAARGQQNTKAVSNSDRERTTLSSFLKRIGFTKR